MKFMPVREFLRGGYRTIAEPTLITHRGNAMFTVFPGVRDLTPRQAKNLVSINMTDHGDAWDSVNDPPTDVWDNS